MKPFFTAAIAFFLLFSSLDAGIIKKSAVVVGAIGAKKAFDKYAKNKFFKSKGVMGNKDVYQQDINPDLVVEEIDKTTGLIIRKSNKERMEQGKAPYIEKDGELQPIELHHSRQKDEGPIFEISRSTHQAKTEQGAEALHPYKTARGREINEVENNRQTMQNPDQPVNRVLFNKERVDYWKNRAKEIISNREETLLHDKAEKLYTEQ